MITLSGPRDLLLVRRLALSAQGLLRPQSFGKGIAGAAKAIRHIGYVQIDSISVVERAHHHVLFSRVPGFQPAMTGQLLASRETFEYWTHAAAFIPMADYRYSLPYKHAVSSGKVHWFKSPDRKLKKQLLDRVRVDGPLRSRDLESPDTKRSGWWDWKPAKKALEQLYMEGELMVSARDGFQKTYDITERVLPSQIDTSTPTTDEFAKHLLSQQLRCHGCVSLRGVTYLRRDTALRRAVKTLVEEGVAEQRLEQVQLPSGEVYVVRVGALQARLPRVSQRMSILSPFDNTVIQRERLKAIFDFDYQLECYVPEAKRKHGYFSLPLLYRDQFVGRMDCKAHRKDQHLEIKALHLEPSDHGDEELVEAFVVAVKEFCGFQACDSVSLTQAYPKKWAQRIRAALES